MMEKIMKAEKYVFVPNKLSYLKGKTRPPVDCILCVVRDFDKRVENLVVYQDKLVTICLNLYPYNVGHLLFFPNRHLENYSELNSSENERIFILNKEAIKILDKVYSPLGYNLGWNTGPYSGASIRHIHEHLVPRYKNELGFLDIAAHTKVLIEFPEETHRKLKKEFEKIKL
jgi:ATP adenylyltransferase